MKNSKVSLLLGLAVAGATQLHAGELIVNGGFELGSFAGWGTADTGSGSWFVTPASISPISSFPTVGPFEGEFYAITDQTGPGEHSLFQSFTIPADATTAKLSFEYFLNNQSGTEIPADFGTHPIQFATIDLLDAADGPWSVGIFNLLTSGMPDPGLPDPWHMWGEWDLIGDFGLTPGETYQIRFAEADDQFYFQMGVDDVSIISDGGGVIPEVQTYATMFGAGLIALQAMRRRMKRA
jgi:hypothetical protein